MLDQIRRAVLPYKNPLFQFFKDYWALTLISSMWAAYQLTQPHKESTFSTLVTNFGACFVIVSWFWEKIGSIISQQKLNETITETQQKLNKTITETHQQLKDTITETQQKLSDSITITHLQLNDTITGGESFLMMFVGNVSDDGTKALLLGLNLTKNTIYDLRGHYGELTASNENELASGRPKIVKFQMGNVPSGASADLGLISLNKETGYRINIFFTCRGGHFIEQLRMIYHEETWHDARRIIGFSNILLWQSVSTNYPLDLDPEVSGWGNQRVVLS